MRTKAANNRGSINQFYVWIAVLALTSALPAQEARSIGTEQKSKLE